MHSLRVDNEEAVEIFRLLNSEKAITLHWGNFPLSDKVIDHPPEALTRVRTKHGIPDECFHAMRPGVVQKS
jgi:hypothetical protein